jgi:hypothetical protein
MKHGLLIQVSFRTHPLTEVLAQASYILYPKKDKDLSSVSALSEAFDFLLASISIEALFHYPITSQISNQLIHIQDEGLLKDGLINASDDWNCYRIS